jgi:hypothetical protein
MRYLWLFVLLSGCATPQERAADVLATFGPYCESLGYTKDTDPWRQCVQMEDAAVGMRAYEMMRGRH